MCFIQCSKSHWLVSCFCDRIYGKKKYVKSKGSKEVLRNMSGCEFWLCCKSFDPLELSKVPKTCQVLQICISSFYHYVETTVRVVKIGSPRLHTPINLIFKKQILKTQILLLFITPRKKLKVSIFVSTFPKSPIRNEFFFKTKMSPSFICMLGKG